MKENGLILGMAADETAGTKLVIKTAVKPVGGLATDHIGLDQFRQAVNDELARIRSRTDSITREWVRAGWILRQLQSEPPNVVPRRADYLIRDYPHRFRLFEAEVLFKLTCLCGHQTLPSLTQNSPQNRTVRAVAFQICQMNFVKE